MSENKYIFNKLVIDNNKSYKLLKDYNNNQYSLSNSDEDLLWLTEDDIKTYIENSDSDLSLYLSINMNGELPHRECYSLFYLDKKELNEHDFDYIVSMKVPYFKHIIKFNTYDEFNKCNWCSLLDFHCTDHNRFV